METATYGSEFTAARIATDQVFDLRYMLRMLGVPLDGPAWLFGDNKSVITSSTLPHSTLSKCHNALSYHHVCEAIAAHVMFFIHISGIQNPSDALSKHLGHAKMWPLVQPLLFWKGETDQEAKEAGSVLPLIEGSDRIGSILVQNPYLPFLHPSDTP